jgi:hypothetical protein
MPKSPNKPRSFHTTATDPAFVARTVIPQTKSAEGFAAMWSGWQAGGSRERFARRVCGAVAAGTSGGSLQ